MAAWAQGHSQGRISPVSFSHPLSPPHFTPSMSSFQRLGLYSGSQAKAGQAGQGWGLLGQGQGQGSELPGEGEWERQDCRRLSVAGLCTSDRVTVRAHCSRLPPPGSDALCFLKGTPQGTCS